VAIHLDRYINKPINIKGDGSGTEITASGIFWNVMKVIKI